MSKLEIDIETVKKLVDLVDKHHLEELTVEHSDIAITVKGKNPRQNVPTLRTGPARFSPCRDSLTDTRAAFSRNSLDLGAAVLYTASQANLAAELMLT